MPRSKIHNSNLLDYSRSLRRDMTEQERKLWYCFLKDCDPKFKRQVTLGNYIADFCCESAMLIVELDGGQHYEKDAIEYDIKRDEFLSSVGYTVLRYSNTDVNSNFDAVCMDIRKHLGE